jgi:2-polyprenyl-3-methyl-5-hydroxy-6-metoxy-1,4-benzoquinol methylase
MTLDVHEVLACPSCASSAYEEVTVGDHRLRRCGVCSLVYAPEYGDPEAIYVDGYMKGNGTFGLDITNPVFQEYLRSVGMRRVDMIEKVSGKPGTLLDVGCGSGELLEAARDRGWDVVGVEVVEESVEAARSRGLEIRHGLLQESGLPERHYDVVSAFHVLEHMSEGTEFLKLIARWVRPGGHLCIEVPNWRSFARRNSGDQWIHLRPLEHLGHYEPKTLAATLERAGLEPVLVRTATYLWSEQSVDQALSDLGQLRLRKVLGPLSRAGTTAGGRPAKVPNGVGWAVLNGARRAFDAAKVGQVCFAMARVPG